MLGKGGVWEAGPHFKEVMIGIVALLAWRHCVVAKNNVGPEMRFGTFPFIMSEVGERSGKVPYCAAVGPYTLRNSGKITELVAD